jgi:death-on-curing protein
MILFISADMAIQIHEELIMDYGGAAGIRDYGLLLSALEMPKASFGGEDLHPTLFEKAAAYLFHIVKNHPFIDGNKRTGAALALVFLEMNRMTIRIQMEAFEDLIVAAAEGMITKKEIAEFFRQCVYTKRTR